MEESEEAEHDLGAAAEIPAGGGREFSVNGRRVAVFRLDDGQVRATEAGCPHHGFPMAQGILEKEVVICPYHGWQFDTNTGEAVVGWCPLEVYPARIDDDGRVRVRLKA